MGIEAAYPPFNNKDASGNVVGFDKDIGDALCAKMKVEKCEVYVSDWDGIIPALNAKKFDFLVSSLSIPDEGFIDVRADDFPDPYYSIKLQFIAPKATADFKTDAAYLKGKVIGAQRATLAGTYLEDKLPDTEAKLYDTQENAYLDLTSGRLGGGGVCAGDGLRRGGGVASALRKLGLGGGCDRRALAGDGGAAGGGGARMGEGRMSSSNGSSSD